MPSNLKIINHYKKSSKLNLLFICLFAFCLFGMQQAHAQEVKVSAVLDSTIIPIGGQTNLKLEVSQPINAKISFPSFVGDTIVSGIEVLSKGKTDTTKTNNRLVLSRSYCITSFDSGLHYIPAIEFESIEAKSKSIIKSNHLSLKVINPFKSVDPKKGIVGIKKPLDTPFMLSEIYNILIYAGIGILIIAILILLYLRYKERLFSKEKAPRKKVPLEPAHIIAIRALNHIKEAKLWEKNQEKQYYTDISDTLRAYIEQRFNVTAMEQTSDEILDTLKANKETSKESLQEIDQVLKLSDLVKFAKFNPLPEENNKSIQNAYSFVNQTKQEEAPKEEEEQQPEETEKSKAITTENTEQ